MHAIAAAIIANAIAAGTEAASFEYDALTPETARALLRRGSDIVPDYAGEAARIEAAAQLRIADPATLRDTRIATLATEAWARAFRDAWPAEAAAALAAQTEPGELLSELRALRVQRGATDSFEAHRASYEDMGEEELFSRRAAS